MNKIFNRQRLVYYKGKKIKLRKYIVINANVMRLINKPAWRGVDHQKNYRKAVEYYGVKGLKHYENRFYKNIPMPAERNVVYKTYYKIKGFFVKLKAIIKFLLK